MKTHITKIYSFVRYSLPFLLLHPLWSNRGISFSPLLRFSRLQLIFFFGINELCLPWLDSLILPIRRGDVGLTGNYYTGLDEFRDMAFLLHLLRPDDTFVDIGANLGSYSLLASGICGSFSIAFEPVQGTYARLVYNVKINDLSLKTDLRPIALTDSKALEDADDLFFSTDRDSMNSFVDSAYCGSKSKLLFSTLDKQLDDVQPALVKIDVEGFESSVISGAVETLSSQHVLAVIAEGSSTVVSDVLSSLGFIQIDYNARHRSVVLSPNNQSHNKLWIKKSAYTVICDRLASADYRLVYGCRI